jgi:hypothetical protein
MRNYGARSQRLPAAPPRRRGAPPRCAARGLVQADEARAASRLRRRLVAWYPGACGCRAGGAAVIPTTCVPCVQMLFQLAPFVSLAGPLDGANGGPLAWVDDQTTYNFTTSPEYGDSSYPLGYNALWSPQWQHFVRSPPPVSCGFCR